MNSRISNGLKIENVKTTNKIWTIHNILICRPFLFVSFWPNGNNFISFLFLFIYGNSLMTLHWLHYSKMVMSRQQRKFKSKRKKRDGRVDWLQNAVLMDFCIGIIKAYFRASSRQHIFFATFFFDDTAEFPSAQNYIWPFNTA